MTLRSVQKPFKRRGPLVEWQVCDSEAQWTAARQVSPAEPADVVVRAPQGPAQGRGTARRRWLALGCVLLVLMLAGSGWLWHTANAGLELIEADVDAAVNADLWPETHSLADVTLVDLGGDVAVVEVALPANEDQPALRQTRVYQRTADGWLRTTPSTASLGASRRLETSYFVFHYYDQDSEAVKAAAARLDLLYPALYAAFFPGTPGGKVLLPPSAWVDNAFFPGAPEGEKLVVQIDPAQPPGQVAERTTDHDPFVVASPAAYLAPVEFSQADLLAQSVVLVLLEDFKNQAAQHHHLERAWLRLGWVWPWLDGVRLWQIWATDLPLAVWREPVVRWVFRPEDARPAGEIPAFAPALCAMHRLWMGWPHQIGVPMICNPQGQAVPSSFWRMPRWESLRLADLVAPASDSQMRPAGESVVGKEVVLATVMEYAATAYGPARIPLLLATLYEHERWETVIQAEFGVSLDEFEAGWRSYLAGQYGVPLQGMTPTASSKHGLDGLGAAVGGRCHQCPARVAAQRSK
jgi:hypothetical protein